MSSFLSKIKGVTGLLADMTLRKDEFGTRAGILAFLNEKQAHGLLNWIKTGHVK